MDDVISRKAAIDALFELYEYQRDIDPTEAADLVRQGIYLAEKKIEQLPSAHPEQQMKCSGCRYDNHASGWSEHCVLCRRNYLNFKDRYERRT